MTDTRQGAGAAGNGRKIKLVVFDLDGTLIDAYRAVEESVNFVMNKLGLPRVGKQRIVRAVGWGERHLLARFVPADKLARAVKLYRPHHAAALKKLSRLLPGAKRLLNYLKREGYLIAAASNRATRFSRIALKQLKVIEYFDCILCRDKVSKPKPHPGILLGIVARLGLRTGEVLYVGDMAVDIEAGRAAGIRTIAVTTGSGTPSELKRLKPLAVVSNVYQTVPVLKKLNSGYLK